MDSRTIISLIFKKFATTGDGILAALKVIECIKYYRKDLETLLSEVKLMPQKLINVEVKNKLPFEEVEEINIALAGVNKKLGNDGRVLLRYSGTENLARVMIEGSDQSLVSTCCHELANIVEKVLG